MIRPFRAMALLLFLAACGSNTGTAPRNLDNACSIVSQNPNWLREMKRAERKWGVPVHVQMATIYLGYSQALDGTWEEYQRDQGAYRAKRTRFGDAVDFMGWYMDGSADRVGISKNDTRNQYLAYHEGRTGFARGSYNSKSWLLRVASEVDARAQTYRAQLVSCGKV